MPQLTRPATAARRGITLVEVLITMTVLAIVGAAVTAILTRQQRFYRDAAETVEVRRELRGGATLLPTDLRAISTVGGDLLAATATQFTIRATIGSAVVCAKGSQSVDLVPIDMTTHTLAAWHVPPQVRDTVFLFDEGTNTGAADDTWWQAAIVSTFASASYCPSSPFIAAADAGRARLRVNLDSLVPPTVQVGTVVRITRPVRYAIYQPSATSDWYLGYTEHDGSTWRAMEPVAGPLVATNGARFVYYDTLGIARATGTAALRASIARVGVTLRATGRSDALRARNGAPLRDSLNFKIGIRNFR